MNEAFLFNPKFLEEIGKIKEKNLDVKLLKKNKYLFECIDDAVQTILPYDSKRKRNDK